MSAGGQGMSLSLIVLLSHYGLIDRFNAQMSVKTLVGVNYH